MSHWQLAIQARLGRVETSLTCRGSGEVLGQFSGDAPADRIRNLSEDIHRSLERQRHRQEGMIADVESLKDKGSQLGQMLVGESLLQRIEHASPESLLIDARCETRGIPVELFVVGDEFLGRRTAVGRAYGTGSSRVEFEPGIRARLIGDPTFELLYAQYEACDVSRLWAEHPGLLQHTLDSPTVPQTSFVTIADALQIMADADWLHVCGHAVKPTDDQAAARGWKLRGGLLLSATMQDAGLRRAPRFVFANACGSAEFPTDAHAPLTVFEHLAQHGCEHFLGTSVPISDQGSLGFVTTFYRAVLAGRSIGEAVRLGRLKLIEDLQEANLLWAIYVLHGDPRSVLVPTTPALTLKDLDMPHSFAQLKPATHKPPAFVCVSCGADIFTTHGIGRRQQIDGQTHVQCRRCARKETANDAGSERQPVLSDIRPAASVLPLMARPDVVDTEAAETGRRVEHFLGKWQHAVERFAEYRDSISGQTHAVTLTTTPISLAGAAGDLALPRLSSQKLSWHARKRFFGRAALPTGLPEVSLHLLGRAARDQSAGVEQGALSVSAIRFVLRSLSSATASVPQVVCLASLTGWDQAARDFVRETTADSYFDPNRSLVLLDLSDDSQHARENDLRIIPLPSLFDFEDDHHKVARVVQIIERRLPLETSLAASSLAQESAESERIVVLAMQQAAQRFELKLDDVAPFGWVLSQSAGPSNR